MEINFYFPNGDFKPHPALIFSNSDLYDVEGMFYFAPISSKDYNSEYAFKIEDDMINFKFPKESYVKCQIIVGNLERDVFRKFGSMKNEAFQKMRAKIIESIF